MPLCQHVIYRCLSNRIIKGCLPSKLSNIAFQNKSSNIASQNTPERSELKCSPKGAVTRSAAERLTNPEVKRRLHFIHQKKLEVIGQGNCRLRNHTVKTLTALPKALDKLVTANTAYYILTGTFDASAMVSFTNNDAEIHRSVLQQATRLVEMALLRAENWVMFTHFDIYWRMTSHWMTVLTNAIWTRMHLQKDLF
ncbi:hypothetical protein BJV82DRAFT_91371 [Fennellomyces sp. T-0311]|nr:hypothetical protein BJV82DRAFT_91371 [Fennellomyces sp. T-0311]